MKTSAPADGGALASDASAAAAAGRLPLGWWLAVACLRLTSRLSFATVTRLGRWLGWLLNAVPSSRRKVGRRNLALCFPDMPAAERKRLLQAHFVALSQMLLEYGYCWFASRERLCQLMRIDGAEHLHRADGRPVILSMPHFTGLDMAGLRVSFETELVSVYSRQKNPALDAFFLQGRLRFDTGIVFSRQAGIRPVLKAMKQGYGLYYLPDQDHGARDAVFVDFFGTPAATLTSLSRLAALTNAVVLPCRPERVADGYVLHIAPPLLDFPGADVTSDARRMNAVIEAQVLQQPHQYYWLHRRFKTRPPGEPSLY